jgi:NAD(P)-binding Rossmann-like domain
LRLADQVLADTTESARRRQRFPGTFGTGRASGVREPRHGSAPCREITVLGGGLAGLIAATEAAEAGASVRLLEARSRLGGRAASTPPPYVANLGPHALYAGTETWAWLRRRGLHSPSRMPRSPAVSFRWRGEVRRYPPRELLPILGLRNAEAPVDHDLRRWLTERAGRDSAQAIAGSAGPLTFDHDPGRLSAAFVVERIRRILLRPLPAARYVEGGWSALIERMAAHAASVGVRIETEAAVRTLDELGGGPVIVAVEPTAAPSAARRPNPRGRLASGRVARRRPRAPPGRPVPRLRPDEAAFFTRVTAVVPTHAPARHDLVQASVGLRPHEDAPTGHARLEAILDQAFSGWRERLVWRRAAKVHESTGALDVPGTTWQHRPRILYGDEIWLAGDWVAAPGHLSEVSCTSAIAAARGALDHARRRPTSAAPAATAPSPRRTDDHDDEDDLHQQRKLNQ